MRQPIDQKSKWLKARWNFSLAMMLATVISAAVFLTFLMSLLCPFILSFGILPRSMGGFMGIVFAPWLHASWAHLGSNIFTLWIMLTLLLYLYPNSGLRVLPLVYFGSGLLVWIVGRDGNHLGASGIVYGGLSFMLLSGFIRKERRALAVSLCIVFLYGTLFWGLLPTYSSMSWELHLSGAFIGAVCAYRYRLWDYPIEASFDWEVTGAGDEDGR